MSDLKNNAEIIPDYISNISNTRYEVSTEEINEYVNYVTMRTNGKKSKKSDAEIRELFTSYGFRQIAVLPKFVCRLKCEMEYSVTKNLVPIQILLNNYIQLSLENPGNVAIFELINFLSRREKELKIHKKDVQIIRWIIFIPMVYIIMMLMALISGDFKPVK